jgi:hypothetical protein
VVWIFGRTIRSVTWLPEEERLELRLVLPEPEDEPAERRVDSVRARGRTPTQSSYAGTPLELVFQVPWSRRL